MRQNLSVSRVFLLFLLAALLTSGALLRAQGAVSVITGTVYSPLGPGAGDPIPNILVYIPTKPLTPFPADSGPGGCTVQSALVSGLPAVGSATTDAAGHFTITSDAMPASVNIVIQAGKWRRQYPNTAINVGGTTNLNLTMPGQSSPTADLPHIAIVTGSVDTVECIFRRIGISDSEFTAPGGTGSINLYVGSANGTSGGASVSQASATLPSESDLVETPATLNQYDVVMFGCQGTPNDVIANADEGSSLQNLVSYADNGGRIFATHYGYVWLDNVQPFESAADWLDQDPLSPAVENGQIATIDQTYPEGAVLAQWVQNVGASYNNTLGEVYLENVRENTSKVNNPPSQSAANLTNISGHPSMQFTFDTPIGSTTPTVGITYQNSTSKFLQGAIGDSITIAVTNNSTTATSAGLTLSLQVPPAIVPTSIMGVGNTGWACTLATLTCTRATALPPAASDSVILVFNIKSTALGQVTVDAALSGGGLSNTNQCGRVLYNDYHVESTDGLEGQSSNGYTYPNECNTGPLTPQEKFLEFSLYNLSNFVAPSTTDTFTIQATPVITWPQPAAITYGTALSSTQLDATANVPGTFAYTPASGSILSAGNETLSTVFTPTDTVDYTTVTASVILDVMKAASATTLTSLVTPIYYGQEIGYTNGIDAVVAAAALNPGVPSNVAGGTLSVYVDGVDECDLISGQTGQGGTVIRCPDANFMGFHAGPHQVQAFYGGNTNFLPSASPVYVVTILPDPTNVAVSSSGSPSYLGQSVTFTATTGNTAGFTDLPRPAPVGTVSFFDAASLPLGTATLNGQGAAQISTSNLGVGKHSITATYAPDSDFVASGSAPIIQIVIPQPPTPLPTATTLQSSMNPSAVGESVTFTASTATTGKLTIVGTGMVVFSIDGQNVATVALNPRGQAAFTTAANFLTAGKHNVVAAYAANTNGNLAASTSPTLVQQVNTPVGGITPGFLLTVTPSTFSVGAGNFITAMVTVTEINGYAEPVQLGCSGLPTESTCTFNYRSTPSTGGSTPLIIHAAAPHNCGANSPYFVAGIGGRTGLSVLAVVVLAFFARRRKALKGILLAAAICILPAMSGCGSGNCTDLAAKPGTYTFKVTGTSQGPNSLTQTQVMTMTITI